MPRFRATHSLSTPYGDRTGRQLALVNGLGYAAVKWKKKALALWDNGEYTDPIQALEYLNNAIYINPYDADTHINRGIAYANIGDINKMCSDFRKACELGNCTAITSVKKNGNCR